MPNLVAEYDCLLAEIQKAMEARHHDQWVLALQAWRQELIGNISNVALNEHAKRTARALGGMESIGEIGLADRDERLLKLVEELFAKCKKIVEPDKL
jgi:hypothetical protein